MSEQTEGRVPVAVWEGTFRLFGVDVRCYVLADGQRIVHAEDRAKLLPVLAGDPEGGPEDDDALVAFARWQRGMSDV